jgi:predicted secreted protein
MTEATHAYGVVLKQGEITVGAVTNISGPALKADQIDVTAHDSPDGYREYIQGLKDGGEIALEMVFVPDDSGQEALAAAFEAGTVDSYTIEYPDEWGWSFDAIVTAYEVTSPLTDQLGCNVTLKVSGRPLLAEVVS